MSGYRSLNPWPGLDAVRMRQWLRAWRSTYRRWLQPRRGKIAALAGLTLALVALIAFERLQGASRYPEHAAEPPQIPVQPPGELWAGLERLVPQAATGAETPAVPAVVQPIPPGNNMALPAAAPENPPGVTKPVPPAAASPKPPTQPKPLETLLRPVQGAVTRSYGWGRSPTHDEYRFHPGVDMEAAEGTEVAAALSGQVASVQRTDETGLAVVLDHGDGKRTLYGNLASASVQPGQRVTRGQVIGKAGTSSKAESGQPPHLHFELMRGGESLEPGLR